MVPSDMIRHRIIDIRDPKHLANLKDLIEAGLSAGTGRRTLPTLLLYDVKGLQLFEEITYSSDYYLTNLEIDILKRSADEIASHMESGTLLVELGSGKTALILESLERQKKKAVYYALDLSLDELKRSLDEINPSRFSYVKVSALHGTYDDGKEWLASQPGPKCILWLGSSIGNETRESACKFLKSFKETALSSGDLMVIGVDRRNNSERVWRAYNDEGTVTENFELNGLAHANRIMDCTIFQSGVWEYVGKYDEVRGCHEAFFQPKRDVSLPNGFGVIRKGEKIHIESSYKYSLEEADQLFDNAGLVPRALWTENEGSSVSYVTPCHFQKNIPREPVPSLDEWGELWKAWDMVTLSMISKEMLHEKPIDLRNACIFYLGHIPTFLDIHLSQGLALEPTPPAYYRNIFERGIDPDVISPEECHSHSEIPNEWPALDDLLAFQRRVRRRLQEAYARKDLASNEKLRRRLWLGFEHEAMHLETLLYMLVQSDQTRPPPGVKTPDWELLAESAAGDDGQGQWLDIAAKKVETGLEDDEGRETPGFYGWDIECPKQVVEVKAFKARSRPITNGEYYEYTKKAGIRQLPATWVVLNGVPHVRTVFGPVALQYALRWPAMASYEELQAYAEWIGGRIPTSAELRSIYEGAYQKPVERTTMISAVNGQLTESGVNETPPQEIGEHNESAQHTPYPNGKDLFYDVGACNIGFKNWHPMPMKPNEVIGVGGSGAWEWTSTELTAPSGYVQSTLYPAYSSDFFDSKHNIIGGGSWATIPRIAGRKSFVNWYQRKYPFAWITARVVQ